MSSEQDRKEEAVLFARIELGDLVFLSKEGVAARYCLYIKSISEKYNISESDLSAAFMEYYGSSLING